MKEFITFLQARIAYLERIAAMADKSLSENPVPQNLRLRISKSNGVPQYYLLQKTGEIRGKYQSKASLSLAKQIAQRDYDVYIKRHAAKQAALLKKCLKLLSSGKLLSQKSHPQLASGNRRHLIKAYSISNEEYAAQWQARAHKGKPFYDDAPVIKTNKDERVRSKSEKIIADKLNEMGIPYKYECPLKIKWPAGKNTKKNSGEGHSESPIVTIYPDFTLLDVENRREIILEHFGMMDDPEYAEGAVEKMQAYSEAGFHPGHTVLFSMETSNFPLDTRILERLVSSALATNKTAG